MTTKYEKKIIFKSTINTKNSIIKKSDKSLSKNRKKSTIEVITPFLKISE